MTELSVILPTYNEASNIAAVVDALGAALEDIEWEAIFVDDDSPDGTHQVVRELSRSNPRVRCLHRIGRRGLSSACIEGIQASSAAFIAVLDADLQHDERILPRMLKTARDDGIDLVVGSRYVDGGGTTNWSENRKFMSQAAIRVARGFSGLDIKDLTSGFFLANRQAIQPALRKTSGVGFKILLDILLSADKPLTVKEMPYHFRSRQHGESKLDYQTAWLFLMMLLDKAVGGAIPVRFLSFVFVGGLGVFVHFAVLSVSYQLLSLSFFWSQMTATLTAMTSNFALNNVLTYTDKRLRGGAWFRGWVTFVLACSIGAMANVGVANYFYMEDVYWVGAALAGILVGVVWNYAITSVYTWKV